MCLILIAHQVDPDQPLLVVANRDEFYRRATAPADYWPEAPGLLAGRDLVGGGTWIGVRGTRWAAVTNVREGMRDQHGRHRSRGWLVRDYLVSDLSPGEFLVEAKSDADKFAGFNLLLGDAGELWYTSNRVDGPRQLPPGIYGLSNHLLDTPWPKLVRAKERFTTWLATADSPTGSALELLTDTTLAADDDLPDTGIPLDIERVLSAMFIISPQYGTRIGTLIQHRADRTGLLAERTYHRRPERWTERRFRLSGRWPAGGDQDA